MNLNDTNIIFLHHDAGSGGDTIATILEDNELFEISTVPISKCSLFFNIEQGV